MQHAFWNCKAPPDSLQRLFYHRGEALKGLREEIEWLSCSQTESNASDPEHAQPLDERIGAAAVTAAFLLAQTVEW